MKLSKLTSALLGLGLISFGSVAKADHVADAYIYLTGSTAARSFVGAALNTGTYVFSDAGPHRIIGASDGASDTVYEGTITGVGTVDVICHWSGSEAGIAAVAGAPLTQVIGGTTYNLPGVPAKFLDHTKDYDTGNLSLLADIPGAPANPDLAMADTSQAVSQTPATGSFALKDYGVVGIVTFSLMKAYDSSPDAAYNRLDNVTTALWNQNLAIGDLMNASLYTGNAADSSDGVVITGRNKGSGTRANALVNAQYGIKVDVKQYARDVSYPAGDPGKLTFGGHYVTGTDPSNTYTSIGNDGFDSGHDVAKVLEGDMTGQGIIMIGYLGYGDCLHAYNADDAGGTPGGAHSAKWLKFNGVYLSDQGVIQGNYTYWGQEHLLGTHNQSSSSAAGKVGDALYQGIQNYLTGTSAGTGTGDVISNPTGQSGLIPLGLMQVHRTSDGGFPIQGGF